MPPSATGSSARSGDSSTGGCREASGVVTNYEKLHYFDPEDFAGVVCDESSIIKSFDGVAEGAITEFMRRSKYRLLCTATAAPNDYIELGTSSEALGELGYMDMLSLFFRNDKDSLHPAFIGSQWRLQAPRRARLLALDGELGAGLPRAFRSRLRRRRFVLPELVESRASGRKPERRGRAVPCPGATLLEQREDLRRPSGARCEAAAELLADDAIGIAWCHLNAEGDLLERLIPGAVQVSGSDDDERKEEIFAAFRHGQIAKLVTKPKIAAFGMNWQHCAT
jgi:hypothetical protein